MENETNVAPEGTSPEPAKTAEIEPPIAAPGVSAGGAGELVHETNVAPSAWTNQVLRVVREYLADNPIEQWLEPKLEALKAEILAKVYELVTPIVAKSAEGARPIEPSIEPAAAIVEPEDQAPAEHELAVGDPVKVWADAEHKTFHLGTVAAIHDARTAYDVVLEDESVTKVPADGLEFDDRR